MKLVTVLRWFALLVCHVFILSLGSVCIIAFSQVDTEPNRLNHTFIRQKVKGKIAGTVDHFLLTLSAPKPGNNLKRPSPAQRSDTICADAIKHKGIRGGPGLIFGFALRNRIAFFNRFGDFEQPLDLFIQPFEDLVRTIS